MLNFSFSHKMTQPELDRRQHVEEANMMEEAVRGGIMMTHHEVTMNTNHTVPGLQAMRV